MSKERERDIYQPESSTELKWLARVFREGVGSYFDADARFAKASDMVMGFASKGWIAISEVTLDNGDTELLPEYRSQAPIALAGCHPRCGACGAFNAIVSSSGTRSISLQCETCGVVYSVREWEERRGDFEPKKEHVESASKHLRRYQPSTAQRVEPASKVARRTVEQEKTLQQANLFLREMASRPDFSGEEPVLPQKRAANGGR